MTDRFLTNLLDAITKMIGLLSEEITLNKVIRVDRVVR
jgi:hypothetical protein